MTLKLKRQYSDKPAEQVITWKLQRLFAASAFSGVQIMVMAPFFCWLLCWDDGEPTPGWFWYFMACGLMGLVTSALFRVSVLGFKAKTEWFKFLLLAGMVFLHISGLATAAGLVYFVAIPLSRDMEIMAFVFSVIVLCFIVYGLFISLIKSSCFLLLIERHGKDQDNKTDPVPSAKESPPEREPIDASTLIYNPLKIGDTGLILISKLIGFALIFSVILKENFPLILLILPCMIIVEDIFPIIYYQITTPFQRGREICKEYSGRKGSRLLIYNDGIEVRQDLRSFFIPYEWLDEPQVVRSFFFPGVPLKSELPHFPSGLLFRCDSYVEVTESIRQKRTEYLESKREEAGLEAVSAEETSPSGPT